MKRIALLLLTAAVGCSLVERLDYRAEPDASVPPLDVDAGADQGDLDGATPGDTSSEDAAGGDAGQDATQDPVDTSFRLLRSDPVDMGVLAGSTTPLVLTFSADVDANTAVLEHLKLFHGRGNREADGAVPETHAATVTLTPVSAWPLGAVYRLELSAGVRDTAGRALTPSTLSFAAPDGSWSSGTRLADAVTSDTVDLAVSRTNGNAALVWTAKTKATSGIMASYYAEATKWVAPKEISASDPPVPRSGARVAINDDAGQAAAAWIVAYGPDTNVESASYDGSTWSAPKELVKGAGSFSLTMTQTGTVYTIASMLLGYVQQVIYNITGSVSTSSQNLTNMESGVRARSAEAAMFYSKPIVAWTRAVSGAPTTVQVYAPELAQSGQLSEASKTASGAEVAVNPARNVAMVVFEQVDPKWQNVYAARATMNGQFVKAQLSDDTSASSAPTVALDALGGAIAAWRQQSGKDNDNKISASAYISGQGWGPPQSLSDLLGGDALEPSVALERGGNGLVVWVQKQGSDPTKVDTWAARYIAGRGFDVTLRQKLSQTGTVALRRPAVGIDSAGRAFAAWLEQGGVWVARFQ